MRRPDATERARRKGHLTPEIEHAIRKARDAQKSWLEVSEIVGWTYDTVRLWGKDLGCTMRFDRHKTPDELQIRITNLRRQGMSWRKIQRVTGVSHGTCWGICHRHAATGELQHGT